MNYNEASLLPRSEKITLITCEAVQLAKIFIQESPDIYSRFVDYFVCDVKFNGGSGIKADSVNDLNPTNQWFYDVKTKKLYVSLPNDPKIENVSIVYRFFFSNAPVILPNDLSNGDDVEWLPLVSGIGSIGQQLDDENTGIVLESQSQIDFINNNGFFHDIFDKLIWENQNVTFYSWFGNLPKSEIKKIFTGVIESKDFQANKVTFKVKDFVFKLKNKVSLELFTNFDGTVPDSFIGTPKRRIYGKANKVKCVPIDSVIDGYDLTGTVSIETSLNLLTGTASGVYVDNNLSGTVSGVLNSNTITGSGTSFTTQLAVNNKIRVTNGFAVYTFTVASIQSNTSITVTPKINVSFAAFTAKNYSKGNNKVFGFGTKFLAEIQAGSQIRFTNGINSYDYSVQFIDSDYELTLDKFIETSFSNFEIRNLEIKNNILKGVGTSFLKELSPEDEIIFNTSSGELKFEIDSVDSDTEAKLVDESDIAILNSNATIKPKIPYRFKNRKWHIAGHRIRSSIAFITNIINARTYEVDDVSEFFDNDTVSINNQFTQITRIADNQIILEQNLGNIPSIGDKIIRAPIYGVYFGSSDFVYNRDAIALISETDSILELNDEAEFNIAVEKISTISFRFENSSRVVTTDSIVDLRTLFKTRDWIKRINQNDPTDWYEILAVSQQSIILRTPYSDFTGDGNAVIKNPNYVNDDSLILVDCYGKDSGDENTTGTWVRTASDAVYDLVTNDAQFSEISQASFDQSNADCNYVLSLIIPNEVGSEIPLIREVVTDINESIFGSLYINSDQELCYSIVNTRKPQDILPIKDDDIINFNVQSNQKICNQVIVNYAPFVDKITGENGFETFVFDSEFVNNNIGIKNTIESKVYLYSSNNAQTIAQRIAFFNSLSQSILTLKAKANFFTSSVNDRVYVELDRLYKRFGGSSNKKIGLISGVKKSSYDSEIVLNDMGNIFNRCPSIAPTETSSFTIASDDEKIKYGFIVDNQVLTPDPTSEDGLGNNLIG